ncbi:MAG: hypothetical protein K6E50_11545 [Lachnospiraceae bacterium]|nr:hypothetical protein [Lachnospiraceae bacterium]
MKKKAGRYICIFLICMAAALLAELFLFNFRFWTTAGNTEVLVPLSAVSCGADAELLEDGSLLMTNGDGVNILSFSLEGSGLVPGSIAVEACTLDGDESWWGYMRTPYADLYSPSVRMTILLEDGKKNTILRQRYLYGRSGEREVFALPKTKGVKSISLQLAGVKGEQVSLKSISLNVPFPLRVLPLRALGVFLFLLTILLLWPGKALWKLPFVNEEGRLNKNIGTGALLLFPAWMAVVGVMLLQNPVYLQNESGFKPYTDLARALAKGQLYLDIEPSEELLSLEDPYDPMAREEIKAPFCLDYAFRDGKYYIYFGVVPCLLLYLPYHLITGGDLPGWIALFLMLAGVYAAFFFLIKELAGRYERRMPAALALLLWLGGTAVLTLPAVMGDSNNYYTPMLPAVIFFLTGMSTVLAAKRALEEDKRKKGLVLTGVSSLLFALIAGCRPQLVLGAACSIPILLPALFPKKEERRRPDLKAMAVFALPYLCVAAGLMVYNHARFGSPFDFGAMYNLTFAFLTQVHFTWQAVGAGVVYYLLRPLKLKAFYPYLERTTYEWSNPSLLASHPSTGGLLFLYPILLAGLGCFVPVAKENKEKRELAWVGRICFVLIPVIAAVTAVMGGLMDRYRMDITVFCAFAMVCGILLLRERIPEKGRNAARAILLVFVLAAVIVSGLSYATEGLNVLDDVNPECYIAISRAIEFWR